MGLLANLALLLGFAWLVRGLLSAHEVTWPRTFLAVFIGGVLGTAMAVLLVVSPAELVGIDAEDLPRAELLLIALPFQLVSTMVAVVAFELISGRPARTGFRLRNPLRALARRFRIVGRGLQVSRIASRHGLAPLLGLRRGGTDIRSPEELARRAREALEDAGGMFVKLGQLLATRPDLLPPAAVAELGRLHAGVRPLPREEVVTALTQELGATPESLFTDLSWTPLGSASIAQVHAARLPDGTEVVLKLRRPGLEEVVERDLAIVSWLAHLAERRTAWGRAYGASALAAEFATALRGELDLRTEARHASEVAAALAGEPRIVVPQIVGNLSTERLVVMERLRGRPLSDLTTPLTAEVAGERADVLCTSQIDAMLAGDRFHADPHPGNVLHLDDGRIGLIDLGATGKLDAFERASMFQLLVALGLQEPTLLSEALVAVGAIAPHHDRDRLERELARFLATHLDSGLPSATALTELLRLLTELGVRLPAQASTMFRALATLAGTVEHLVPGYPIVDRIAERGGAELKARATPESIGEFVQQEWAQVGPLLRRAPRHLDRIATQLQHGGLTTRVRLFGDHEDVRVVERLVNRVVLTALALGAGLLSVLMLGTSAGPLLAGSDLRLLEVLGWLGLFASTVLLLRVLLAVLRAEAEDP